MQNPEYEKISTLILKITQQAKENVKFGSITVEFFIQEGKISMIEIVEKKEKLKFI